jgi:hypothetical protein
VRAYGSAARECLRAAEQRTVLPQRRLTLEVRTWPCRPTGQQTSAEDVRPGVLQTGCHTQALFGGYRLCGVEMQVPLGDIGIAYGQVSRVAAEQLGEDYSGDGKTLRLMIRVQAAHAAGLEKVLADMSSGRIRAVNTESQLTTPDV